MKVIIDFIEDVRENIGNREDFILTAMLLREDEKDSAKLVYAGESPIHTFELSKEYKCLSFSIDGTSSKILMGDIMPNLLIAEMDTMMYELVLNVNAKHQNIEIIGFGKNEEEGKYILFIKL